MSTRIWLAGPGGHRVQVDSGRRDELAERGWAEAREPSPEERVWLQHDVTGAFAPVPAAAVEAWQPRGWQYAVPPTARGDLGHFVALPTEPDPAAPETPAAPPAETKSSKVAERGDAKEK